MCNISFDRASWTTSLKTSLSDGPGCLDPEAKLLLCSSRRSETCETEENRHQRSFAVRDLTELIHSIRVYIISLLGDHTWSHHGEHCYTFSMLDRVTFWPLWKHPIVLHTEFITNLLLKPQWHLRLDKESPFFCSKGWYQNCSTWLVGSGHGSLFLQLISSNLFLSLSLYISIDQLASMLI